MAGGDTPVGGPGGGVVPDPGEPLVVPDPVEPPVEPVPLDEPPATEPPPVDVVPPPFAPPPPLPSGPGAPPDAAAPPLLAPPPAPVAGSSGAIAPEQATALRLPTTTKTPMIRRMSLGKSKEQARQLSRT